MWLAGWCLFISKYVSNCVHIIYWLFFPQLTICICLDPFLDILCCSISLYAYPSAKPLSQLLLSLQGVVRSLIRILHHFLLVLSTPDLLFHILFKSACQFLYMLGLFIENTVNLYIKLERSNILTVNIFLQKHDTPLHYLPLWPLNNIL